MSGSRKYPLTTDAGAGRRKMNNYELAEMLHDIASDLIIAETVRRLPSCNTCGKVKTCVHRPLWGADIRYNCFDWVSESEAKDD